MIADGSLQSVKLVLYIGDDRRSVRLDHRHSTTVHLCALSCVELVKLFEAYMVNKIITNFES